MSLDYRRVGVCGVDFKPASKCWWDSHEIEKHIVPKQCPVGRETTFPFRFKMEGFFCSWNCAFAYGLTLPRIHDVVGALIYRMRSIELKEQGKSVTCLRPVAPAPHWAVLESFGGNVSIRAYRENFALDERTNPAMLVIPDRLKLIPQGAQVYVRRDLQECEVQSESKSSSSSSPSASGPVISVRQRAQSCAQPQVASVKPQEAREDGRAARNGRKRARSRAKTQDEQDTIQRQCDALNGKVIKECDRVKAGKTKRHLVTTQHKVDHPCHYDNATKNKPAFSGFQSTNSNNVKSGIRNFM